MSLVLPLRRLDPEPQPVARTLDLDAPRPLEGWVERVRTAPEACFVLDRDGRIAAMSHPCGTLLGLDQRQATGALLVDVIDVVDDPEYRPAPLRALAEGRLARGLVRLRQGEQLRGYDVVGVPLSDGAGALGFVLPA